MNKEQLTTKLLKAIEKTINSKKDEKSKVDTIINLVFLYRHNHLECLNNKLNIKDGE